MQTLSFQAPEELKARLESCAVMLDRSKGYLIRQALLEYLEDIEDYTEVKRYKAKYDPKRNVGLEAVKRKYKLQ